MLSQGNVSPTAPIVIVPLIHLVFRRRFNTKKAHWGNFAKYTVSYIQALPALPTHCDTFVEMIKRSSRRNLPRGCRTTYIPGLTDDFKVLYNDYEKHFQWDPFSADTLEWGDNLTKAITESRNKINVKK